MSGDALLGTHRTTTAATTERTLRRLEQLADDRAFESQLQSFLARRRAVRQARLEQAAEAARHEHELLVQSALLEAGLTHLR